MKQQLTLLAFVLFGLMAKAQTNPQENSQTSKPPIDTSEIFVAVQKPAMFPGGIDKLNKFLRKNSKYSVDQQNGTVRVFVQFVVERDGSVTSVKIMSGASLELDTEAIRLIKASAPWIPGEENGYKIRQQFTIPIKFEK